MLTEKEIEEILYETGHGEPEPYTHAQYRADAAAAIAKRLSEGVVWRCEGEGFGEVGGFAAWMGMKKTMESTSVRIWKEGMRRPKILVRIFEDLDIHGQLVSVTVKIMEGTKDGQDSESA